MATSPSKEVKAPQHFKTRRSYGAELVLAAVLGFFFVCRVQSGDGLLVPRALVVLRLRDLALELLADAFEGLLGISQSSGAVVHLSIEGFQFLIVSFVQSR